MAENDHCFVEWKEHFVSQERGNRVVHYFLKDSAGESILAVVGTERSVRHMFYVVSEEFLQAHGNESCSNANFKWRSRREVVDWLTSMLSMQYRRGGLSELPQLDSAQASGTFEYRMNGLSGPQIRIPNDSVHHSSNIKGRNPDIVWSGAAWTCGKQLKHFPSFCRDGIKIATKSFVFVMANEGENHYVAYVEDMYEDKKGQRKVKVRWFHHKEEVKGVTPLRNPHPKEVFITPYVQVISAECVDGPATVLTREHYEKCLDVFPQSLLARIHLCCRQFKKNKVKPFDVSKMHGYFDQPIFSCFGPEFSAKSVFTTDSLIGEEDELGPSDYVKLGSKRTRSGRSCQRFATDHSKSKRSTRDSQMPTYRPQSSEYGLLEGRMFSMKLGNCQPWYTPLFKVDEKIELLCQDSGIRGCWFRCTVLQISRKQIKVQYDDLQDEEGCGNLEEWVPAFRLAMPDKLGIRHDGRPTVRPAPQKERNDLALEVGDAIDAWWSDGWWEGIITGVGSCGDNFQVFFPGERLLLNMHKKDLRISRDWLGDQWVDVEAKPNVLSAISSKITSCTPPFTSSTAAKDVDSDGGFALSNIEVPSSAKLEEKLNLAAAASFDALENMDLVNDKKSPLLKDFGTECVDVNGSCCDVQDGQDNDPDDDKDANNCEDDKVDIGDNEVLEGNDANNGEDEKGTSMGSYEAIEGKDAINGEDNEDAEMGGSVVPRGMEEFETPGQSPKVAETVELTSKDV